MGSTAEIGDLSLGQLVASNANRLVDKPAIIDKNSSVSYGELYLKARALSLELIEGGLFYEEPVAILTSRGAEHIITQVAIVYAGGTCLPLDPGLSNEDLQARLTVGKVKCLVVDKTYHDRHLRVDRISVVGGQNFLRCNDVPVLPRPVLSDFRSHILFTSGTTGTPKAVQVPGRGILRIAYDRLCHLDDASEDRFGHINNTSFDLSLIDTWVALINGATIIVLDREEALSPELFARSVKENRVTTMVIPAALFSAVALACPTAFSELKTLILGAETPNIGACRAVLEHGPPGRLLNGYGPTECSILAVGHEITLSDVARGYLPIGKPLYQTDAYVLNDSFQPVVAEEPGELFLGGSGLSRGYLHNPEKTQKSFLTLTGLDASGHAVLVYRTGDLVYTDYAGNMVWLGRRDREIKFSGYRIQLEVIEAELLLTGLVSAVAAMKVQLGSSMELLVACVVCKPSVMSNVELLSAARARLPKYMVPQLVTLGKLPINRNGKIDRKQVTNELMESLRQRQNGIHISETGNLDALTRTENELKMLWSRILITVPLELIVPGSDFFALGATSINVSSLIAGVREVFGIVLPTRAVYEHPNLGKLAIFIDEKRPDNFADHAQELKALLRADAANLGKEIPIPIGRPTNWLSANEGNVFVTGATGFVGAYLLVQLLQLPGINRVRCLIRAESSKSAFNKLFANLEKYQLGNLPGVLKSKVEVLPGDFARPRLGLSQTAFHELADWASVIYHLGAQVNYNEPYNTNRPANVLGTLHILQLAATGKPKPLHYTSSIAAFGPTGLIKDQTDELSEDDTLTQYLDTTLLYETGYGQSQWVADEIVSDLMRRGFPVAIYRLGFVFCDSDSGIGNPDDFVGRLLTDCLGLGIYPLLPHQRKELLLVDYAASAIKQISMSNGNLGRAYHVTPDARSSIDMNDLFRMVGQLCRIDMTGLGYQDWIKELKKAELAGANLRLKPLFPVLEEKVYGELTRWEVYEGMAKFSIENTTMALSKFHRQESFEPPAINEEILNRYLRALRLAGKSIS